MRGGLTGPAVRPCDPLQRAVDARLHARLDPASSAPVALGLSGGGDSLALLHLAAAWCAGAGRPLLALTVDHGLSPDSAAWTAQAGRMARETGASWRALAWTGAKPSTGLPAAARGARHALLADAARAAGAGVVLLAHTFDDHAETEALRRADVPAIGALREWAPSPAWPQGRGVFLLRPLLAVRRVELRAWLGARGLRWLEDPANADPRFARARLRARGPASPPPAAADPVGGSFGEGLPDGRVLLPQRRLASFDPAARRSLAAALACAAGAPGPPRGRSLDALLDRLDVGHSPATSATATCATSATTTISTLGGARLQAESGVITLYRDPGRHPPQDVRLPTGSSTVWDGRFEARAAEPGWRIGLARGRAARLPPADRDALRRLPAAARGASPVFEHDDGVVRWRPAACTLRALAPSRFDAAIGRIASEADLAARCARE